MSTSIGSRSSEDQLIADRIITTGQVIEAVKADSEIAGRLAQVGYGSAKLQEGAGLQRAAQTAFEAWRSAARTAHRDPQMLDTTARAAYNARQMGFPAGVGLIAVNNPASVDETSVNLEAAVADRDAAVQQLDAWVKSFTLAAQEALRDRPDMLKRLTP